MPNKGPVFIVPWRCTFACDSTCVHCTSACKPQRQGELGTADAKKIVDQVADFGATFFGVTGGQPFLRKDLFEVLDYATQKGLCTSIITDGRLLDEEAFKRIVKNQTRISVSLDGGTANQRRHPRKRRLQSRSLGHREICPRETPQRFSLHFRQRRSSNQRQRTRHASCARFSQKIRRPLGGFPRHDPLQQRQNHISG